MAGAGVGTSFFLSAKVLKKLPKFKYAGSLATIFVGEALATEGIDRAIESRGMNKRTEQNLKNVAGGTIGLIGALAGLRSFNSRKSVPNLRLVKPKTPMGKSTSKFLKKNIHEVAEIGGLGLLIGSEFVEDKKTKKVMDVTGLGAMGLSALSRLRK
jgi:hypothetical protein